MNSWRYKLISFMSGRYGNDKLNSTLLFLYFAAWIANLLIGHSVTSLVLDIIQLSLLIIAVTRMFSRNIYRRRAENETFLRIFGRMLPDTNLLKNKIRDRHTHIYKKCPQCKSILRLKKISGEHTALCPKCHNRIKVKIK